jgi:hypothetical protein
MLIWAAVFVLLSLLIGAFGRDRKMGFWGYFFASMLLTPAVGLLLVLGSDRRLPPDNDQDGKPLRSKTAAS